MTGYAGYTESAEKIEARKRRILAGYKPQPKRTRKQSNPAPVVADRLMFALAIKRQQQI